MSFRSSCPHTPRMIPLANDFHRETRFVCKHMSQKPSGLNAKLLSTFYTRK